jgi:hypothetical protein
MALAHHPRTPRLASSGHDGRVVVWEALTGAKVDDVQPRRFEGTCLGRHGKGRGFLQSGDIGRRLE